MLFLVVLLHYLLLLRVRACWCPCLLPQVCVFAQSPSDLLPALVHIAVVVPIGLPRSFEWP
uniref:Secreted peptide n=1 Tax=Arundo donax TaxID=35708 RepID=A0A0A9GSJ5_ARUDO